MRTVFLYWAQAITHNDRYTGWVVRAEFSNRHRNPLVLYRPTLCECLRDLVQILTIRRQKGSTGDDQ